MTRNCAFFIDSFKGMPGKTYFINGDHDALVWLAEKIRQMLQFTANSNVRIGDGNPFESDKNVVEVVPDNALEVPRFGFVEHHYYKWSLNCDHLRELASMIDAMTDLDKPCHNYFDVASDDIRRVFISIGEYSDTLLGKMAKEHENR